MQVKAHPQFWQVFLILKRSSCWISSREAWMSKCAKRWRTWHAWRVWHDITDQRIIETHISDNGAQCRLDQFHDSMRLVKWAVEKWTRGSIWRGKCLHKNAIILRTRSKVSYATRTGSNKLKMIIGCTVISTWFRYWCIGGKVVQKKEATFQGPKFYLTLSRVIIFWCSKSISCSRISTTSITISWWEALCPISILCHLIARGLSAHGIRQCKPVPPTPLSDLHARWNLPKRSTTITVWCLTTLQDLQQIMKQSCTHACKWDCIKFEKSNSLHKTHNYGDSEENGKIETEGRSQI